MESDSIKDLNRYIVNREHHGSIIPGNRSEMWRNIYLESGATIHGGVFGNNLNILGGDVKIDDSVYVRGVIRIAPERSKTGDIINFGSTVITPDSLIVEGENPIIKFNSDLYVNKIKITNSIIYGNIYCSSAILNNCIVLGGIYCKGKLSLSNSIVYTFDTHELNIRENVSLLSPFGISSSPFELEHTVKALTFFDLIEKDPSDSRVIMLDEDDMFEIRPQPDTANEEIKNKYILSIVERILDSTSIIQQFRNNKKLIEFLSLGTHLDFEYGEQFQDYTKDKIEDKLWEIINRHMEPEEKETRKKLKDIIQNIYYR